MDNKRIFIEWSKDESSEYFLDGYHAGWDRSNRKYWLNSHGGKYTFCPETGIVMLDDGVSKREVKLIFWVAAYDNK